MAGIVGVCMHHSSVNMNLATPVAMIMALLIKYTGLFYVAREHKVKLLVKCGSSKSRAICDVIVGGTTASGALLFPLRILPPILLISLGKALNRAADVE